MLLLFICLFHGSSMELEGSYNLSPGLCHVEKPLLIRPASMEPSSHLLLGRVRGWRRRWGGLEGLGFVEVGIRGIWDHGLVFGPG